MQITPGRVSVSLLDSATARGTCKGALEGIRETEEAKSSREQPNEVPAGAAAGEARRGRGGRNARYCSPAGHAAT